MEKLKEKTNIYFKTEQKNECLERLLILKEKGLLGNVVNDFKRNNLLYYSEQTALGGILYWLTKDKGAERFENIVKDFEKENNAIVYHVIHCYTDFGELLNLLYVSSYEEEWKSDKKDLRENYSFSYVINLDDEIFSEYGSIGFEVKSGGLIRTN